LAALDVDLDESAHFDFENGHFPQDQVGADPNDREIQLEEIACDSHASLSTLNCPRGFQDRNIIRLVLRLGLQREQPSKVLVDLCSLGAGFSEKNTDLVMVLARRSTAGALSRHCVGRVDGAVNRQAGRRYRALSLELALRSRHVLLSLG
jgi:hypothetical protein